VEFRIADSFSDSLVRLTGQEQKAVKTTAFDLQMDVSGAGLSFHKLDHAKDPNFWSVRVNSDIRLIVHKTKSSLLLVYVDHHDAAYKWAERRKIERHPTTGAMQLVEVRELIRDVEVYRHVDLPEPVAAPPVVKPPLFGNLRKFELMAFGVPEDWVDDVRRATEDTIFEVIEHLPQEAQEALLKLAVGEQPEPVAAPEDTDPFEHPDALRRFRALHSSEELERALDYPWEKWAVFLHPDQRHHAERHYPGPVRISGSAGTGKTVVALHRAVNLARENEDAQILLTTFSKPLANALKRKLSHLAGNEPEIVKRVTVKSLSSAAYDLYSQRFGQPNIAPQSLVSSLLKEADASSDITFSQAFLHREWADVVDAWQLDSWEAYRDVSRLGRRTRVGGKQREALWAIFKDVREGLKKRNAVTWSGLFGRLTDALSGSEEILFDHVVVDEAQDVGVAEARFLAALVAGKPDGLFFAGDLGQRIFQQPFSWISLGIDIRGRSHTLKMNYRTSHQIRSKADRLLPTTIGDVDGNLENRRGTVSIFDGPAPEIRYFNSSEDECQAIGNWVAERLDEGCQPDEIGIFVRSEVQIKRARSAVKLSGAAFVELSDKVEVEVGKLALCSMHLAKGLEFRAVVVMACDDEVLPLQERIESVVDESDLEDAYDTERHLLYVACTRAREQLLITGVNPVSEFLADLGIAS
tara:strand:- start:25794 stop:27878 length:2085 start_codon:yes stop_codon:yes gene_type:complete